MNCNKGSLGYYAFHSLMSVLFEIKLYPYEHKDALIPLRRPGKYDIELINTAYQKFIEELINYDKPKEGIVYKSVPSFDIINDRLMITGGYELTVPLFEWMLYKTYTSQPLISEFKRLHIVNSKHPRTLTMDETHNYIQYAAKVIVNEFI